MANPFSSETIKRSGVLYVALPEEIIVTRDLTGRKDEDPEIASLAADIFKNGQNQPVLFRANDKGQPVLVYGHRRRLAVDYINKHLIGPNDKKVQVLGRYEDLSEMAALVAAIGENRFRKDVSPVSEAHNISILLKRFKQTVEQIAEIYFPEAQTEHAKAEAVRWVKNRAAIEELVPEVKEAVEKGEMKVTTAVEIAKGGLTKEEQREVVAQGGSGLKGGKKRIKVSDVKKVKAKKAEAKGKPAPAKKVEPVAAAKANTSVYEAAEALAKAVDLWLEDATEKAQDSLIAAHKAYRRLVPLKKKAA